MAINMVVLDGIVKSLALKYGPESKPELRFTLEQQDGAFSLYLPCCAVGAAAERLATEMEDGQHVVVTSGKLCYRKRDTKAGPQSRLELLVWSVDRLSASSPTAHEPSPAYGRGSDDPAINLEAPRRPRKRPYPKAALQGGFQN
jgi:hypothetical protein